MYETVKDFIIKKFIERKGWDKFEEDILGYGSIVTDKEGNRVDPKKITSVEIITITK